MPVAGRVRVIESGPTVGVFVTGDHCADGPRALLSSRIVSAIVLGQEKVNWPLVWATLTWTGLPIMIVPVTVAEAVKTVAVTLQL